MVAAPPPTVSFAHLPPGWHSYAGVGALATSWAFRPDTYGGPAGNMPKDGIIVQVFFPNVKTPLAPLRLVLPRRPATMLEGTTDTPEYRIEGSLHGRAVFVWVDIRSKRPTAAQRRAAQAALRSIRFGGP